MPSPAGFHRIPSISIIMVNKEKFLVEGIAVLRVSISLGVFAGGMSMSCGLI
jgi:hypothetical protein